MTSKKVHPPGDRNFSVDRQSAVNHAINVRRMSLKREILTTARNGNQILTVLVKDTS